MRKPLPLHTLAFSMFPLLALYVPNIECTPLSHILRPILVMVITTSTLAVVLRLIIRDIVKVSLIISAGLFLFYTYGYTQRILAHFAGVELAHMRDRWVMLCEAIILFPIVGAVLKAKADLHHLVRALNILALFLLIMPVLSISYLLIAKSSRAHAQVLSSEEPGNALVAPESPPNIYYILLDGYGRSDILSEYYGLDNSEFISNLQDMGFYIADEATANYPKTLQSLTSTLNLSYVNDLTDFDTMARMLENNVVMSNLRKLGYKITTFASGWHYSESIVSDDYRSPGMNFTEYESGLLALTPIPAILRKLHLVTPLIAHRRRVNYVLDTLPQLANSDGPPIFVFAHVLCPHYPYTFTDKGGFQDVDPEDYSWNENQKPDGYHASEYQRLTKRGYRPQIQFISSRVSQIIARILMHSQRAPIIIIQGDHGPDSRCHPTKPDVACLRERFPILSAYYFPDGGEESVYPQITPCNTFRVLFNYYFGAQLELLPDRNYWSTYFRPLQFLDVTDKVCTSL